MSPSPGSFLELYRAITENELHTVENLLHNGVDPQLPIHLRGSESRPTSARKQVAGSGSSGACWKREPSNDTGERARRKSFRRG